MATKTAATIMACRLVKWARLGNAARLVELMEDNGDVRATIDALYERSSELASMIGTG